MCKNADQGTKGATEKYLQRILRFSQILTAIITVLLSAIGYITFTKEDNQLKLEHSQLDLIQERYALEEKRLKLANEKASKPLISHEFYVKPIEPIGKDGKWLYKAEIILRFRNLGEIPQRVHSVVVRTYRAKPLMQPNETHYILNYWNEIGDLKWKQIGRDGWTFPNVENMDRVLGDDDSISLLNPDNSLKDMYMGGGATGDFYPGQILEQQYWMFVIGLPLDVVGFNAKIEVKETPGGIYSNEDSLMKSWELKDKKFLGEKYSVSKSSGSKIQSSSK